MHATAAALVLFSAGVAQAYTPDSGFWEMTFSGSSYTQDSWKRVTHCGLSSDTYTVRRYAKDTHHLGASCSSIHNLGIYVLEDQSGNAVRALSCDNQEITMQSRIFQADQDEVIVDTGFPGNGLARFDGLTLDECQDKCDNRNGCWYFTWDQMTNKCWLKSHRGSARTDAGKVSGHKVCHNPEPGPAVAIGERGGMCAGGYYILPNELTQYVGRGTPDWDDHVPGWTKGVTSSWSKLKMDFNTFVVDASNSAAATAGATVATKFASVSSCTGNGGIEGGGKITVDLRGTPFAIKGQQSCDTYIYASHGDCGQWHGHGWSTRTKVTCSNNNQLCTVQCGGWCGGCSLAGNELKLRVVDQALLDAQCPTRTAEPTAVPTTAEPTAEPTTAEPTAEPTTAHFYYTQQMTDALSQGEWETGTDGDIVYKCHRVNSQCFSNHPEDRKAWDIFEGIPQVNMGANVELTTNDGAEFHMDTDKIQVITATGTYSYPWGCSCQ